MYHVSSVNEFELPAFRTLFFRSLRYSFASLWIFAIVATYDEALGLFLLVVWQFVWFAPWALVVAILSKPILWLIRKVCYEYWVMYIGMISIALIISLVMAKIAMTFFTKIGCIDFSAYVSSTITSLFALGGWASSMRRPNIWLERLFLIGWSILIGLIFRMDRSLICSPSFLNTRW